MANVKISELTAITSSSDLANADIVPIVDNSDSSTKRVALSVLDSFWSGGGIWCTDTNIAYLLTDCVGIGTATPGTDIMFRVQGDSCYTGDIKIGGDVCIGGDDLFMNTNTSGYMLIADGTNFNPVAMSGDVAIDSAGATTIQATSVENSMLAGSIANAKLSNSSITLSDGSNTTAINLGGTMTFSGTSNEIEVAESSGTLTIGLPSTITGLTTVCATNFAGTLATAAQTNVTSLGTLTALTVDSICLNGATIGHTSDTDLITLADGAVTIAGDLTISGDDLVMGTNTSGYLLVADGTNYNPVAMSGDIAIDSSGATTIQATSVDNSMLAGSIANSKLSNSSLSYGGVSVSLGSSDATPAFDLCDATAYKGDSALVTVGTVTSGTWQGTAVATGYVAGTLCDKTLASPVLCGTISGNAFLDEDDMSSDSASKAASQQSIKAYVDSVASGLDLKCSSHAATTANLSAAYDNGSSGVGATLTNNSTQAALSIDGQTMVADERALVKDQSSAAQNGIYTVSTVGDASTNWVLTRATDFDTPTEITSGAFTFVETGSSYADSGWVMTTDGTVTVGTTALSWTQFSGAGQITAGDGMTKSGNTLNVGAGSNLLVSADAVAMCSIVTSLTTVCATNFAGTLATAAQANVTSLGTLTALTVDSLCLDGSTIGHTSDTDLITLADGAVTIAGDLTISGDDLIMGTNTSGYLLIADGTNFNPVAMSGDIAIDSSGATTIQATSVDNSMLAGSIANAKLSNSSVSYGGISLSLGGTDATPAFNLCDATGYKGDSALVTVGTIASGTWNGTAIANGYLANSSVSYGGVSVSLGSSDATPAICLCDATAYKGDSALVTTGALNSGSITSGFGNIDNGSSTLDTGAVTVSSLSVGDGNITNVGDIAVDTISGDADSNTTIEFPGSDVLTLNTGGSEAVRIDSSQNVGIGTTTPNEAGFGSGVRVLSIEGDTTGDFGAIELISTNAASANRIGELRFINMDGTSGQVAQAGIRAFRDSADDATAISFYTEITGGNFTEKMRITSDGNVGIGTTAPDGTLHVFTATAGSVSAPAHADELIIENSTHAGISILTPNDVSGYINFGDPDDNNTGAIEYSHYTNSLIFYTNATTERMRINCAGNVGIGTTAPDGTLHVFTATAGSVTANTGIDDLVVENSGDGGITILTPDANKSTYAFGSATEGLGAWIEWSYNDALLGIKTNKSGAGIGFFTDTYSEAMRITSAGNVGIGTATVAQNLVISDTNAASAITIRLKRTNSTTASGVIDFVGSADAVGYSIGYNQVAGQGFEFNEDGDCTRMFIKDGGAVGIGTTAPDGELHVVGGSAGSVTAYAYANEGVFENDDDAGISILGVNACYQQIVFGSPGDNTGALIRWNYDDSLFTIGTGGSGRSMRFMTDDGVEAMRIDSSQNVGIGTAAPEKMLQINHCSTAAFDPDSTTGQFFIHNNGTDTDQQFTGIIMTVGGGGSDGQARIDTIHNGTGNQADLAFSVRCADGSVYERMRINTHGNVGIGTTAAAASLELYRSDTAVNDQLRITQAGTGDPAMMFHVSGVQGWYVGVDNSASESFYINTGSGNTGSGIGITTSGAFSKTSGSFKIEHPLESKKDTHKLVHSFIEGPQADLIYSGIAQLSGGTTIVNIDTKAGMTEGTFVALNRCVRVLTSNESNWDAVKGSITGNILTIESNEATSAACISWMVVGERCDKHMMVTEWTDEDGKVIVEPEKTE